MIVKMRTYPLKALLDEILLMRLPKNYPKYPLIHADFLREMSGYRGEQALDYYLSFLPEDEYYIFQNLRLKIEKWTFQIDFLLLTTKFALIVEAKNHKGSLYFDGKFHQLIQTANDEEKGYEDPIAQAERQKQLLAKWLKKYSLNPLPIDYIVVMSNSKAILTTDSAEVPKKVCKPYKLLDKIEQVECRFSKERIDLKAVKKLCKLFLKHHTPKKYDILKEYGIPIKDILTGVYCPDCKSIPMVYSKGTWYCKFCNFHSKDTHIPTLNDYFHLFPSISVSQFKEFFHLPTRNVAQKVLYPLNLPSTGTTKNRIYYHKGVDLNEIHCTGKQNSRRKKPV